ncbi:MAG: hypothetical protein JXB32_07600, partial [Deltaproteobacteria bacterium]|nr:hypothetical protein [Deltaproteobacteria bacterium]
GLREHQRLAQDLVHVLDQHQPQGLEHAARAASGKRVPARATCNSTSDIVAEPAPSLDEMQWGWNRLQTEDAAQP